MQGERRSDKCKQAHANFLWCVERPLRGGAPAIVENSNVRNGLISVGAQWATPIGGGRPRAVRSRETDAAQ
jgi:hypothetical protein